MQNRSKKIRLGIFILIGTSILLFLIVYITAREFFRESDTYYVTFRDISVSGMETGSPVKYLGINVGTISKISINPEDITSIIVELALKPGTPIKEDAKADIVALGITGMKAIEIRGGTNEAKLLSPGSYIQAGSSLASEITGRAEVIAKKAENVLNNLQVFTHPDTLAQIITTFKKFSKLAQNADQAILKIDSLIAQNKQNLHFTLENAAKISDSILNVTHSLKETTEKINLLIQSDSINQIIGNTRDITQKLKESDISQLIEDLARVAKQTKELLEKVDDDINKGSKDFLENQEMLKATLRNLEEASRKINNNPSILIRKSKAKNLPDDLFKD
ncbi:MlaD family protein [Thermophagus xiamenensis]|uniref:ABC-type transporter Mla maintaining outer membrane lipid asymmetry, component MlaD n=1 Tax=Thermophagus xiamenensis TaxID=385682 RepID=A0A1I1YWN9_9BACT|nr:MlaD family protein [Thermophagus xiamenensis]SFE23889.1 ABC-type transporter Mla maintaining outer membrane lipid asymmetry, component MlaD [Thermophagus xiamenensis]